MPIERQLAALVLMAASPLASALNLQLKPSAHAEVERDSNIYRAPDETLPGNAPRRADTIVTTGGGARLTLRESLQELELRGEYDQVDYRALDTLDYGRYLVGAQARLAYASLIKLKLDAGRERRQENFAFRDDAEQGLITIDQASAELRAAITPRWTGIARADHYETEASRLDSQDYDVTEDAGELGIEYRRNGYSSLGLALRNAEGEYPRRVSVFGDGREKDYNQRSVVTRLGYTPSGLSDFNAQLAYTQRRHDDPSVPDFSGVTGRASYTRKFSGKSRAQLELYRDLYYVEDVDANYVENLGLRASYDYQRSAKLALAIAVERYESSYEASPGQTVAGEARQDDVFNIRVGADYQPFYRFSILPQVRYERRGSNLVNNSYDFNVFGVDLAYEYGVRTRRP